MPYHVVLQGVRYSRESTPMWENFLVVSTKLEKVSDVIYAFHTLLDLRQKTAKGSRQWEVGKYTGRLSEELWLTHARYFGRWMWRF
jgi:hypothetical protein